MSLHFWNLFIIWVVSTPVARNAFGSEWKAKPDQLNTEKMRMGSPPNKLKLWVQFSRTNWMIRNLASLLSQTDLLSRTKCLRFSSKEVNKECFSVLPCLTKAVDFIPSRVPANHIYLFPFRIPNLVASFAVSLPSSLWWSHNSQQNSRVDREQLGAGYCVCRDRVVHWGLCRFADLDRYLVGVEILIVADSLSLFQH